MVAGGYDANSGAQAISNNNADLVAYGRPYIANPDLVERIAQNTAWNEPDASTFYGGAEQGYTDYPTLNA